MPKKFLIILLIAIPCAFVAQVALNYATVGCVQRMASGYDATEYTATRGDVEMRLTVSEHDTLVGWFKDKKGITNIKVVYENYGTQYEDYTAKIYNSDTNEYIDYVKIICDGKKLKLSSKINNLDDYDPPNILDNMKKEDSIYLRFGPSITLEATE